MPLIQKEDADATAHQTESIFSSACVIGFDISRPSVSTDFTRRWPRLMFSPIGMVFVANIRKVNKSRPELDVASESMNQTFPNRDHDYKGEDAKKYKGAPGKSIGRFLRSVNCFRCSQLQSPCLSLLAGT